MKFIPAIGVALLTVFVTACGGRGAPGSAPAASPLELSAYASQKIVLAPAGPARIDSAGWVARFGGARSLARKLDTAIVAALARRGLDTRWVLPAALVRSHERNRAVAPDPYLLSLEQLRAPAFRTTSRVTEPLSSQLRTLVALHEDARLVLIPVELRVENTAAGPRGILRTALLDPRFAEARWVGDVNGDATGDPDLFIASVASRLADLFATP